MRLRRLGGTQPPGLPEPAVGRPEPPGPSCAEEDSSRQESVSSCAAWAAACTWAACVWRQHCSTALSPGHSHHSSRRSSSTTTTTCAPPFPPAHLIRRPLRRCDEALGCQQLPLHALLVQHVAQAAHNRGLVAARHRAGKVAGALRESAERREGQDGQQSRPQQQQQRQEWQHHQSSSSSSRRSSNASGNPSRAAASEAPSPAAPACLGRLLLLRLLLALDALQRHLVGCLAGHAVCRTLGGCLAKLLPAGTTVLGHLRRRGGWRGCGGWDQSLLDSLQRRGHIRKVCSSLQASSRRAMHMQSSAGEHRRRLPPACRRPAAPCTPSSRSSPPASWWSSSSPRPSRCGSTPPSSPRPWHRAPSSWRAAAPPHPPAGRPTWPWLLAWAAGAGDGLLAAARAALSVQLERGLGRCRRCQSNVESLQGRGARLHAPAAHLLLRAATSADNAGPGACPARWIAHGTVARHRWITPSMPD